MWPELFGGIGLGALAVRSGMRAAQQSGVQMPGMPGMPALPPGLRATLSGLWKSGGNALQGFESPMTRAEAKLILNLKESNPAKDSIREAHRKLLVANHPDKGGSTYVASKINEAKEIMLGKKTA
mmetsp:Transcript_33061/g.76572  ORF Transcript_33061/g.76572 Transcript_33061/m.76572 type:complete len:125 (-) Transcript_33061:317-691(-)